MTLDILRAELERLFELEQLTELSQRTLGLDLGQGGHRTKGSFVAALLARCVEDDAIGALCDALVTAREGVDPEVQELRARGYRADPAIRPGAQLGPYRVEAHLGTGTASSVLVVRQGDERWRMKLIHSAVAGHRASVQRFFAMQRAVKALAAPGLPTGLRVEMVEGRAALLSDLVEGQPLRQRLTPGEPIKLRQAWPLVRALVGAVASLHKNRLVHGGISPENVLVRASSGADDALLLDAGAHLLRVAPGLARPGDRLAEAVATRYAAPEQLRGEPPTARSDVFSLGAVLYELLAGRPVFEGDGLEALVAHFGDDPEPLSFVSPTRWFAPELDELLLKMLDRDPAERPIDAEGVLDVLEIVAAQSVRLDGQFPKDELAQLTARLVAHPTDHETAGVLAASIERGAMPGEVAAAFVRAAEQLGDDSASRATRQRLLTRAGVIYESNGNDPRAAVDCYRALLASNPQDENARAALERIYRHQGNYEAAVELLLETAQSEQSPPIRGQAFAKMGQLLASRLGDSEQALFAFAQAFCLQPEDSALVVEIERLAGARTEAWREVLTTLAEGAAEDLPPVHQNRILAQLAHWQTEKLSRPDRALACYQRILKNDPASDIALSRTAEILRRAQQWRELGDVLLRRADAAVVPARARDLRVEAAQLLEERLDNVPSAIRLYEQVFADDPSHAGAGEALARLHAAAGNHAAVARILEQRIAATTGEQAWALRCRLAELQLARLGQPDAAAKQHELVLRESPGHPGALRGLERIYLDQERHAELVQNLETQVSVAVTARQKIRLLERIATIQQDEFRDLDMAAEAYRRITEIDPDHADARARTIECLTSRERWPKLAEFYEQQAETAQGSARIDVLVALGELRHRHLADAPRALEAFEAVLAIDPKHRVALGAVASIQAAAGDDDQALAAMARLADEAGSPESQSVHLMHAARILERKGDLDGVVELCKRALDGDPDDATAAELLRSTYVKQGEVQVAIELLEREIGRRGGRARAQLCVELAELFRTCLHDASRAEGALARALEYDPTHLPARALQASITYESGRYDEALPHLEFAVRRHERLEAADAATVTERYLDTLRRVGEVERALQAAEDLAARAPDALDVLMRIAEFFARHAPAERAREFGRDLLERFGDQVDNQRRASLLCSVGRAAYRAEQFEEAIAPLEEAIALSPACAPAIQILVEVRRAQERWPEVAAAMQRQLELVTGDDRVDLLAALGDLQAGELDDAESATQSYLAAVAERPGDRKLMIKLMQLYGSQEQWGDLVDAIIRLAGLVDDGPRKAKYLQTAARVVERELGDAERAVWLLNQAIKADPSVEDAVVQALSLHRSLDDLEGAQRLLEAQVRAASDAGDRERAIRFAEELADLHLSELRVDDAIEVYEAVQRIDPGHPRLQELLAELYVSDPTRYLARAVEAQERILATDPYRPDAYRLLRQVYVGAKRPDAVWCVTQVLTVLHRASTPEELFFKRNRRPHGLKTNVTLNERDWSHLVAHPSLDRRLTDVMASLQSALIAARAIQPEQLGLGEETRISVERRPYGMVLAFDLAARMLGMPTPRLHLAEGATRAVSLQPMQPLGLILGPTALDPKISARHAAFLAAYHLVSLRPGPAMRYLVPNPIALKAWVLASIKLVSPRIPIAPQLEGAVDSAHRTLSERITGAALDRLVAPVHQMLSEGGQLDIGKWMAAVDHTADRVGFIACDDLETALGVLEAAQQIDVELAAADRARQLLLYSVSRQYIELRERLQMGIDWRETNVEEVALDELLEDAPVR